MKNGKEIELSSAVWGRVMAFPVVYHASLYDDKGVHRNTAVSELINALVKQAAATVAPGYGIIEMNRSAECIAQKVQGFITASDDGHVCSYDELLGGYCLDLG